MDSNGLIRVGGRLRHAKITADKKNPIVLNAKCVIIKLLVGRTHKELLHAGPQLMMTSPIFRYWIIGIRSLARFDYNKCVICAKVRGQTMQQMMADLLQGHSRTSFPIHGCGFRKSLHATSHHRTGSETTQIVCVPICLLQDLCVTPGGRQRSLHQ